MRSLAQQQETPRPPAENLDGLTLESLAHVVPDATEASLQSVSASGEATPPSSIGGEASLSPSRNLTESSAPSECGSLRLHSHGSNFVGSGHWTAVLDSITELRNQYEEEEAMMLATGDHVPRQSPGLRLLYEPVNATKADILASIPARFVVDRMVARYFNARGVVPEILHTGHFLREVQ